MVFARKHMKNSWQKEAKLTRNLQLKSLECWIVPLMDLTGTNTEKNKSRPIILNTVDDSSCSLVNFKRIDAKPTSEPTDRRKERQTLPSTSKSSTTTKPDFQFPQHSQVWTISCPHAPNPWQSHQLRLTQ